MASDWLCRDDSVRGQCPNIGTFVEVVEERLLCPECAKRPGYDTLASRLAAERARVVAEIEARMERMRGAAYGALYDLRKWLTDTAASGREG